MNESLKTTLKENIAQLGALVVIIAISIARIFIDAGLLSSGLLMLQWAAIGVQWVSIARSHARRKILRMKDDKKRFISFVTANAGAGPAGSIPISGEFDMHFMVPFSGNWYERIWYKLGKRKTALSLYRYGPIDERGSYTKLFANNKEMFEMQLRGLINTTNAASAVKALDFLQVEGKWDLTA